MEALVALRAMLANLEKPFGYSGAVNQILQALRNGELTGICDQFHGRNASNRPIYELPDLANSLALPMQFWGYAQWQCDGETKEQPASSPYDPWIFNVDWRSGNFCLSGSRGRGRVQIISNAFGVRLRAVEAEAFLVKRGVSRPLVCGVTERPTDDKIRAKMLELGEGGMNRDQAAKAIRTVPGFEMVGNEEARRAVAGQLKRGRPPRNPQRN